MVPGVPDGAELDPHTGVRPAAMATTQEQLGEGNRYRCLQPDDLEGLTALYPPNCVGARAPGITPTIKCPSFEHEAEFVSGGPQKRMVCLDTCDTAGDAVCQDGGPGAGAKSTCELGTDCTDCGTRSVISAERSKALQALMYALTGALGLFGLTLLVLLVVSSLHGERPSRSPTAPARPTPTEPRAGDRLASSSPNRGSTSGGGTSPWSSFGLVFPAIFPKSIPSGGSETAEIILFIGPFIHCILMPFLWVHKHREDKKWIENHLNEDVVVTTALDPEAKTTIFSRKLACGKKCKVLLLKLTLGLVDLVLRIIKYASAGTIDLSAFWFPAPFYNFWKAKMQIDLIQIDGAKICTNATQADAYMKFCTEAVLNWWTLGLYGKCCSSRTSYGRWLDRHVLWQGKPPEGYNNRESAPVSNSLTHTPHH